MNKHEVCERPGWAWIVNVDDILFWCCEGHRFWVNEWMRGKDMDWIRFDKQLPPEDTTVMVSNGPCIGHYHYKADIYAQDAHKTIPLWDLSGVRTEVSIADVIQWAHLLPQPKREIPLTKWQRAVKKMKELLGMTLLILCIPMQALQQSKSAPVTPLSKRRYSKIEDIQRRDSLSTQSTDDSIQELINLEIIRQQIEEKLGHKRQSSRTVAEKAQQ